jgi:hypothetical protein
MTFLRLVQIKCNRKVAQATKRIFPCKTCSPGLAGRTVNFSTAQTPKAQSSVVEASRQDFPPPVQCFIKEWKPDGQAVIKCA